MTNLAKLTALAVTMSLTAASTFAVADTGSHSTPPSQYAGPVIGPATSADNPYIDLHAHMFMKEGFPILFKGHFTDAKLTAKSWQHKLSNQITAEALDDSYLGVVVVSLYALHPLKNPREAIRKQIQMAKDFVAEYPNWMIAKTPSEARTARAEGKRVLIFSLEGVNNVIETEADIEEFVETEGVRIVTFSHLRDSEYSGCAFLSGIQGFSNPFQRTWSLFWGLFGMAQYSEGEKINRRGLSDLGAQLARKLNDHGVWIDLTHSSDKTIQELIPLLDEKNLPALFTHMTLRKYYGAERGLAQWHLEYVKRTDGIVGLAPSHEMLGHTIPRESECQDDMEALKIQYDEVAGVIGGSHTMIGSDFNGAIKHLKPGNCPTGTSLDGRGGLWNISQTGDLWKALKNRGASMTGGREDQANTFFSAWEKVFSNRKN